MVLFGSVYFWEKGLKACCLSCEILESPASHLAFGLRNFRPAKTALSPRASSILQYKKNKINQSCYLLTQERHPLPTV